MASITIKGQQIDLLYTTYEMKKIQEEIAPLGKAIKMLAGINPENEEDKDYAIGAERIGVVAKFIRIMGNAALEEAGEEPNLTEKSIMRRMKQGELREAAGACMEALSDGMESEIPEKEQKGPVDVTLEEINKKKEKES